MIRCIVASNEDGSREEVFFTDDLDCPATDCVSSGLTIDIDEIIGDLPNGFPLNYTLYRS